MQTSLSLDSVLAHNTKGGGTSTVIKKSIRNHSKFFHASKFLRWNNGYEFLQVSVYEASSPLSYVPFRYNGYRERRNLRTDREPENLHFVRGTTLAPTVTCIFWSLTNWVRNGCVLIAECLKRNRGRSFGTVSFDHLHLRVRIVAILSSV